jgi:hypothetical protein
VERTEQALIAKRDGIVSARQGLLKVIEGAVRRAALLPGADVDLMLAAKPADLLLNGTTRASTLIDWFVQVKDGLAREYAAMQADHAHDLFTVYLSPDTVSLVIDAAR